MNFSEFIKLLGADPWSRETKTRSARSNSTEFAAAAEAAEAFERKLETATQVQPPESLLSDLLNIPAEQPSQPRPVVKNRTSWLMALAATVFVAIGAGSVLLWQQQHYTSIEDYVSKHVIYDGDTALTLASGSSGVSSQQVNQVLGKFATIDTELVSKIRYIKACPTPNGKGAHFVFSTDSGLITVIYMPNTISEGDQQFSAASQRAHIIPLEQGSIAIIAGSDQAATAVTPFLRTAIQPRSVDT